MEEHPITLTSDKEKASAFNDYFSSVFNAENAPCQFVPRELDFIERSEVTMRWKLEAKHLVQMVLECYPENVQYIACEVDTSALPNDVKQGHISMRMETVSC